MTNQDVTAAIAAAEGIARTAKQVLNEKHAATAFFCSVEPGGCEATPYVVVHRGVVIACAETATRAREIADEINAVGYPHTYEYQLFAAAGLTQTIDAETGASIRDALRSAARIIYVHHAPDGTLTLRSSVKALVDVIDEYGLEPEHAIILDAIEFVAAEIVRAHVGERRSRARASFEILRVTFNEVRGIDE